jgi:HSP20 family protein
MATNLTRYNPTSPYVPVRSLVDQLLANSFVFPSLFDRWFSETGRMMIPANLAETNDAYIVQVALPGIDPEKLEINVTGRELRVKGTYHVPQPENATYIWQGLQSGEFTESFTLPAEVQGDKAEANYHDGILTVTLPKHEHARVKSIPVKTNAERK